MNRNVWISWIVAAGLTVLAGCPKPPVAAATPPPPAPQPTPNPEPRSLPQKLVPRKIVIQKNVIRLKPGTRILFATNSDELLPESFDILDEVFAVMSENASLRIRVEGHTDSDGTNKANKDLSNRRAASVMKYLIEKGIAEDRLESFGCGEEVPVADNNTPEGKQENRRVEFVILKDNEAVPTCQLFTTPPEALAETAEEEATETPEEEIANP